MTATVNIVEMRLAGPNAREGKLAEFAVECGGLRLEALSLCEFRNGSVRIFPRPKAPVQILDAALRDQITEAAHRAYCDLWEAAQ